MEKMKENEILLETGTNELEIVVFRIGEEFYGINVAKVREIIRGDIKIVPVPDGHSSLAGVVNIRGKIIPVVNLAKYLNIYTECEKKASRIIISEFNKIHAGFLVDEVTRIHRISWQQVEPPSGLINSQEGNTVGVVKIEEHILFLLDFEKIASIINPGSGIEGASLANIGDVNFDRGTKNILIAEDSAFIRSLLVDSLRQAGYKVQEFQDGREAWTHIEQISKDANAETMTDHCNLLITDIEMPQMDGLHLIKRIKESESIKKLPCIVFSSMISPELSVKCKQIGAVDQITKPELDHLVKLVDTHVL